MPGFFNRQSAWKFGLQVVNLGALTIAAYDLYQNPEKLGQNGFDMVVHAVNFLSLRENVGAIESFIVFGLNSGQVGGLYTGVVSGCATLAKPLLAVAADVAVHTLSSATILLGSTDEETVEIEGDGLKMN